MAKKSDAIAVFDSGVGGISVLRELIRQLPEETFLYFGDSANAPYGTKTAGQVRELTLQAAKMLFDRDVKALVVACNTATAAAIDLLRQTWPEKIIIGIEPAVKVAADRFPAGRVGVLATPVTLQEEKFLHLTEKFPQMQVFPIPLPGLVERIETGASEADIEAFLAPTLAPYKDKLDAAVLGCTHYPFAKDAISRLLGKDTQILDGSVGTAQQTRRRLEEQDLLAQGSRQVMIENSAGEARLIARCAQLLED